VIELSRNFLAGGPIAGDQGDVSVGIAYGAVFKEIGQAIVEESSKDAENSQKIIEELKTLRNHLKQEALKHANTRISQLPPDIAREFLDVNRSIKQITGAGASSDNAPATRDDYKQLVKGIQQDTKSLGSNLSSIRNQAFRGGGIVGTAAVAGADALIPGMGIVVKAIQENSQAIKDTYYAVKGILEPAIRGVLRLTVGTFKAIFNFLNPFSSHGLLSGLAKLFKGGTGGTSLFSGIFGNLLLGSLIRPVLVMAGTFITSVVAILSAFAAAHLIDILAQKIRDLLGRTPMKDWKKVLDFRLDLPYFGDTSIFSITADPNAWWYRYLKGAEVGTPETGRGVVVGGQVEPASFNMETGSRGLSYGGFNQGFNTGVSDKGDTVLELLNRQTVLLSEILKALISGRGSEILRALVGGRGSGIIKAYQTGGNIPPGKVGLTGEAGRERLSSGGKSVDVGVPTIVKAGKDPVTVTPLKGSFKETVPPEYVSPIGNPNVDQELLRSQVKGPGYIRANIRMNNPGAVSVVPDKGKQPESVLPGTHGLRFGGSVGDPRGTGEGETTRYTRYDTPEQGIQAQHDLLLEKVSQGHKSVEDIIVKGGWAAKGQGEYVTSISKTLGVDRGTDLHLDTDKAMLQRFQMAQSAYEAGSKQSPYPEELFRNVVYGTPQEHPSQVNQDMPWPRVPTRGQGKPTWKDVIPSSPSDAAVAAVTPPSAADARLPSAGQAQQPANLNVTKAGAESVSDGHRRNNVLRDNIHKEQERQKSPKTPAPQRHSERQAPSRSRPYNVAFTNVGAVALASGKGFS
jgi:hypothetical protein